MMKRFSQQRYNESQGQGYLDKKQRKENDTRRAHTDKMKLYLKQDYLDKKQRKEEDNSIFFSCLLYVERLKRCIQKRISDQLCSKEGLKYISR